MDLAQAKSIASPHIDNSKVVVVLSNTSVWNLDNESQISSVLEYAKNNKLELFIVKNESESAPKETKETKKTK